MRTVSIEAVCGVQAHREVLNDVSCHYFVVLHCSICCTHLPGTWQGLKYLSEESPETSPTEPLPHSAQEAVASWGSGGPWALTAWAGTRALPIASRDSGQVNPSLGGSASPFYKVETGRGLQLWALLRIRGCRAGPEQIPGAAGGGERSCCGTGGCLSRPSPRAARDSWVSWAGTAGLRYFRSKSNQMRIYNPS